MPILARGLGFPRLPTVDPPFFFRVIPTRGFALIMGDFWVLAQKFSGH
jgi:hypothetical protein